MRWKRTLAVPATSDLSALSQRDNDGGVTGEMMSQFAER